MTQVSPAQLDLDSQVDGFEAEEYLLLEVERGLRFAWHAPAAVTDGSRLTLSLEEDDHLAIQDLAADVLQAGELQGHMDIGLCLDSLLIWEARGTTVAAHRAGPVVVPHHASRWSLSDQELRLAIKSLLPVSRAKCVAALVELWDMGARRGARPHHLALKALRGARLTREELFQDMHKHPQDRDS